MRQHTLSSLFRLPFHPRRMVSLLTGSLLCGTIALAAHGDDIKLSTGEVLSVQIKSVKDGSMTFVHPVLGEITLPASQVTILPPPPATGTPEAKAAADKQLAAAQEKVKQEEAAV